MPSPTPFHPRTQPLCETYRWKEWAGYYAVCIYGYSAEREYNAVRQGAGLLDVTPLMKYDVAGKDAARFLSRVMVRDIEKLKPGRMTYLCWCDGAGKVLDDGTCANLGDGRFRVTSAAPAFWWLKRHAGPFDVTIEDITERIAAVALQGPTSRDVLKNVVTGIDMDALKFFGIAEGEIGGAPGWVSRTGYTGDLGYEIWVANEHALVLWDALIDGGKHLGIEPIGLDTLDITRVEAGFILRGVDYAGAQDAVIEAHKMSPFELGLDWTVKLKDRDPPFVGQPALEREQRERSSRWAFVGLDIDWPSIERLFERHTLPPHVPCGAWRTPVPIYFDGRHVGRATSGAWSPILKKNLALATVEAHLGRPGTVVDIEWTAEWERRSVPAVVTKTPFFDPERKRS